MIAHGTGGLYGEREGEGQEEGKQGEEEGEEEDQEEGDEEDKCVGVRVCQLYSNVKC